MANEDGGPASENMLQLEVNEDQFRLLQIWMSSYFDRNPQPRLTKMARRDVLDLAVRLRCNIPPAWEHSSLDAAKCVADARLRAAVNNGKAVNDGE